MARKKDNDVFLISCIGADWDFNLPEYFVRHYLDLGIAPENFLLIVQSTNEENLERLCATLRRFDIEPKMIWNEPFDSRSAHDRKKQLQKTFARHRDWILHTDLDEFQEYPVPLRQFIEDCDSKRLNLVVSCFLDRLAANRKLEPVAPLGDRSLFAQYPLAADVVGEIKQGKFYKNILYRAYLHPKGANHKLERISRFRARPYGSVDVTKTTFEERLALDARIHHFGWTADTLSKLEVRIQHYRDLGLKWWENQDRFLLHYRENGEIQLPTVELGELTGPPR